MFKSGNSNGNVISSYFYRNPTKPPGPAAPPAPPCIKDPFLKPTHWTGTVNEQINLPWNQPRPDDRPRSLAAAAPAAAAAATSLSDHRSDAAAVRPDLTDAGDADQEEDDDNVLEDDGCVPEGRTNITFF